MSFLKGKGSSWVFVSYMFLQERKKIFKKPEACKMVALEKVFWIYPSTCGSKMGVGRYLGQEFKHLAT